MPVARFVPPPSPIDAIGKALDVAKSIYGIQADSAKVDVLRQQQQQQQLENERANDLFTKLNTPGTKESDLEKSQNLGFLSMLANTSAGKKTPELTKLQEVVSDPATSGYQAKVAIENSPLIKHVTSLASKGEGLDVAMAKFLAADKSRAERNDLNANQKYSAELKPYETTIQAANRADNIINEIKNGDLKSTKLLRTDLSAALGSMFNNGKGATVYSMGHADVDTAYGNMQNFLQKYTGKPMNTIPPELLDQVQKDVEALRDSYSQAHEVAYSSFREGLPERMQNALDSRFNKFREKSGLQKIDLSSEGKATGGVPALSAAPQVTTNAHPQDSAALQWAKQNPNDPRAAKILQLNGAQ